MTAPIMSKIALIIPVKDRRTLIIRTLDSVIAQTRRPDILVVVDNGSSDGTPEAVSEWAMCHPDICLILGQEERPGASAARNAGICLAREAGLKDDDYLMFFDSDDIMLPPHIERIAKELERLPETDLLYFDISLRDNDGWTRVKSVPGDAPLMRSQLFHSALGTSRYAVKASVMERAGGWDEELPRWNDYELGVRLILAAKTPRKLCGEPTAVVLPQEQSITGSSYSKDANVLHKALEKIRRELVRAERKQDLRYLAARKAIVAGLFAREGDLDDATPLINEAIGSSTSLRDKTACRLAYLSTLLSGRGGAFFASWLMAPPREKTIRRRP